MKQWLLQCQSVNENMKPQESIPHDTKLPPKEESVNIWDYTCETICESNERHRNPAMANEEEDPKDSKRNRQKINRKNTALFNT